MDSTSLNFLVTILRTVLVENERLNILWDEIFTCSPQNSVPNVLKLSFKKTGWKSVEWIHLAQDRNHL